MNLIINNNEHSRELKQYILSDADSGENIGVIQAEYEEDVTPKVLQALREHHDEDHDAVYDVQVLNNHNTKFKADGIWDENEEDNERAYNLIATPHYF